MERRERVMAALQGEPVDRPPVALWRHFPEEDQTAEGLARATAAWQARWGWDFVKVTPTSGYPIEDWGATFEYRGNDHGTRTLLTRPVRSIGDLQTLPALDVRSGVYGRELRALEILRDLLDEDAPVLETVFSPLDTAQRLMGELLLLAMDEFSTDLHHAMRVITEVTTQFALAALESGADGIFFATQMAQPTVLDSDQLLTWGVPYDLEVLTALRDHTDFLLLHIHGDEIYFDPLAQEYPVDAINWHVGTAGPSFAQALEIFDGALVGGVTEPVLVHGPVEKLREQVRDAFQQTGGRRLMVAAGCVTPIITPDEHIAAVRAAVEDLQHITG